MAVLGAVGLGIYFGAGFSFLGSSTWDFCAGRECDLTLSPLVFSRFSNSRCDVIAFRNLSQNEDQVQIENNLAILNQLEKMLQEHLFELANE